LQSTGSRLKVGTREIDFQELVGDEQIPVLVAIQQVMAAREPEIPHRSSPRARPVRSTSSTGSSSRASRNEKACHGRLSPRSSKVRKASRMASASTVRRTAIKVSGG